MVTFPDGRFPGQNVSPRKTIPKTVVLMAVDAQALQKDFSLLFM